MNIYFQKTYQRAFGTFPLRSDELANALNIALDVGYRAIDTAQMYQNEADIGRVIKSCGIPREQLMVTTKVHPDNFSPDRFISSVEESLQKLQLDVVDVLLLHWPPADGKIQSSLELVAQAKEMGFAKHIGVSNYTAQMMRDATKFISIPIVTNQVEFHPLLNQDILLAASAETGIPLSAYCSIARGKVFEHSLFEQIGTKYKKSAGQIVLHWILQKGVSINTMSSKEPNIRANFNVMDFTLAAPDMESIDSLTQTGYRIVTKDIVPWAPVWD